MKPSRRALLVSGSAVAVGLFSGGAALFFRRGPAVDGGIAAGKVFTADEMAVLYALASALLPQGGGAPDLRREVIAAVDGLVSTFHPADQAELKTAMLLFENALIAFVLDGRAQPLSALDPVAARRALLGFQRSRLAEVRTAFRAIRGLICGAWGAMPALDAVTGYPGPPDFGQACAADPWTDQPACPAEVSP